MSPSRIAGIILLVVGILLLFFGFQATESVGEQVHETVTGRFTETTTWYLIGGAAAAIGGLALVLTGKSK
ncbi:MAG: DUF3185 family protein [Puniceicoccaceae bacterium]|nr:MAG: DUF3185 family protein [Puniceicoccaceae bacterium]